MARPAGHRLSPTAWEDVLNLTGLSLSRVSEISGIPRPTISVYLGGHSKASVTAAKAIADALGVNPATIFPTLHPNFTFVDSTLEAVS